MTNPWIYRIKMFLAVAVILVFPQLFIHFIGDNPMKVIENESGTRSIAIVNEDIGTEDEENSLQLGREVPPILEDGSEYKWTVLSRSAAVNGLKNNKYDAVVYIPSNFTSNILTYDESQPTKADFQYTVQTQLNAVNKEKVLRELDYAGNRVNKQMSSLYWNYVSQDMKKVRTEFDRILEKEIEFQTAMVSFYSPSSKVLADELQRQKDMLVQLQASMQQADETSPQRANNLEQFERNLASFVKYVEQYKDYQGTQQKLLNEAQQQSLVSIQTGKESFAAKHGESSKVFREQGNQFITSMSGINKLLQGNNESITELNNERLQQAERQKSEMSAIHDDINNAVDTYNKQQQQAALVQLEQNIKESRGQVGKGDVVGEPEKPSEPQSPEKASLNEELQELDAIKNVSLQNIINELKSLPEDPNINNTIVNLEGLSASIGKAKDKIETKANQDGWKLEYENLLKDYNSLSLNRDEVINVNNAAKSKLYKEIVAKEKEIPLSFSGDLAEGTLDGTLAYYALLSQYESELNRTNKTFKEIVNPNDLNNRVEESLNVNEEEKGKWDKLQTNFPVTQQEMQGLGDSFSKFKESYEMSLEEQQVALMSNIDSIEESANTVLTKLQDIQSGEPEQAGDGSLLVSNQQSISQEILNINSLMDSLGERQTSVVNYTDELQGRVNNVQNDANVLNQKWSTNVASTQSVREDVFNVLGNTYMDGQSNGYVYDYLANPLNITGDTPQVGSEAVKAVPPVVILIVILISSLLIGYFSHYFSSLPFLVRSSIFGLLNLIVGLVISLFGLEIYSLSNNNSIQFSIFTILLLIAASTLVRVAFNLGNFIGWLATMGLILFFVSPLLALVAPNFSYEDPMSAVYMSIQYDTDNHFRMGCFILIGIIAILSLIPYAVSLWRKPPQKANTDKVNEAF